MNGNRFLIALVILLAAWGGAQVALFQLFPAAGLHWRMSVWSGVLFTLICIAMFLGGRFALKSSNRNAFTGLVLASVFGKMVVALGLLFAYRALFQPENSWYVGIFLLNYIVFTAFEVGFLLRMVRTRPSIPS